MMVHVKDRLETTLSVLLKFYGAAEMKYTHVLKIKKSIVLMEKEIY
jgi:hypothetical protein